LPETREKRVYKPAAQKQAEQMRAVSAERKEELTGVRPSLRPPKWAAPLGAVVLILAGIGIYFLMSALISALNKPQDNSHLFNEYTSRLSPVVMFDPPDFDSADTAPDKQPLLLAALQRAIEETGNEAELDEMGNMLIPAADVSRNLGLLFGEAGKKLHLVSLNSGDIQIEFNILDQNYHVPVVGYLGGFAPKIIDIQIKGEKAAVHVGYLEEDEYETGTDIVKTKMYTMIIKEGQEPYILSISEYTS